MRGAGLGKTDAVLRAAHDQARESGNYTAAVLAEPCPRDACGATVGMFCTRARTHRGKKIAALTPHPQRQAAARRRLDGSERT